MEPEVGHIQRSLAGIQLLCESLTLILHTVLLKEGGHGLQMRVEDIHMDLIRLKGQRMRPRGESTAGQGKLPYVKKAEFQKAKILSLRGRRKKDALR